MIVKNLTAVNEHVGTNKNINENRPNKFYEE